MKKTIASLLCLAALGLASSHASAQVTGNMLIKFEGPGGHSNGAYGRTNAVHAAGRTVVRLQSAGLPSGSYRLLSLGGGNSVNSIASDGEIQVALTAADMPSLNALAAQVKAVAEAGAAAENDFRGVKAGDLVGGVAANIRVVTMP